MLKNLFIGFSFAVCVSSVGFPGGSAGKESACNVGDQGSIPGLGRSPGEGKGYPLQYSGLENSMDCIVHGVTKSQTRLSDFQFTFLCSEIICLCLFPLYNWVVWISLLLAFETL